VRLLLLGMNHRTAPLALRERFAVEDLRPVLAKLVAGDEIEEAVLLSTCNRVEIVCATQQVEPARMRLQSFFERELDREAGRARDPAVGAALYEYGDTGAVRHLFRVASSIDSMVLGEPQILGQVKDAYRAAVACGACGPLLTRLFQHAFATAKRVRSETRIAERPVSVARIAAELASEIFDHLGDKAALLVGAGEMTELALERLRSEGLVRIRVANRTLARAADLAGRFGGSAHTLDELPELLPLSDVVLTSIGGDGPLLGRSDFDAALAHRRSRPVFVIDIGVPRNVSADVNELDNVYLYDIDDLSSAATANAEGRRRELITAEAVVLEEQQRFDGWLAALGAVPTIRDLRDRAEAVRRRELDRALNRMDLTPEQRDAVDAVTRAIVNKLLHPPVSRLRDQSDREQGLATLEAARTLFGLDDRESDPDAEDEAGGS